MAEGREDTGRAVAAALREVRERQDDPIADSLRARLRQRLLGVAPPALAHIDRFEIIEAIGRGGMGVVYRARDPRLEREVAIKVVGIGRGEARERLLDEARALARLAHPNVVGLHDAGPCDDGVYLAMELVSGRDLRAHLNQRRHSWRAIAAVFADVARGLQAAHDAGIVHGDVKPGNVLVGTDGRARLVDFGLARGAGASLARSSPAGTPGYLAPEQLEGAPASPRADQYAFCVALFEALCGRRPGPDRAMPARGSDGRRLPRSLRRAIERGLHRAPERRHVSMDALAQTLDRATRRRTAVAALTLAALAGALAASWLASPGGAPSCADGEARFAALAAGFSALPEGPAREALTRHRRDWGATYDQICTATHVRGDQSGALLDLRMQCLSRSLAEARELTHALATAPGPVDAARAVAALPPPRACATAQAGATPVVLVAPRLEAARRRVRQAWALRRAGRPATAHAVARDAMALSAAPGLRADALLVLAGAEVDLGEHARAEATAGEALNAAAEAGDDAAMARAWLLALHAVADGQGDVRRAHGLLGFGRAAIVRGGGELARADLAAIESAIALDLGLPERSLETAQQALAGYRRARGEAHAATAHGELDVGLALAALGRLDEAEARVRRALAITRGAFGDEHPALAIELLSLGSVLQRRGSLDDAADAYRQAAALVIAAYGRGHPHVVDALNNLASALLASGRTGDAAEALGQVRAICESMRPDHPGCGNVFANLGKLAARRGELSAALAFHERALAARVARLGSEHPAVGHSHNALAGVYRQLGDLVAAELALRRALDIWTRGLGAADATHALALYNLGDLALQRRRWRDARRWCAEALALDEPALGAEHPDLAYDLTCLGEAHGALGQREEAIAVLRRAHALRRDWPGDPFERGRTALSLATALWATGDARERCSLVETARADLQQAGDRGRALLARAAGSPPARCN